MVDAVVVARVEYAAGELAPAAVGLERALDEATTSTAHGGELAPRRSVRRRQFGQQTRFDVTRVARLLAHGERRPRGPQIREQVASPVDRVDHQNRSITVAVVGPMHPARLFGQQRDRPASSERRVPSRDFFLGCGIDREGDIAHAAPHGPCEPRDVACAPRFSEGEPHPPTDRVGEVRALLEQLRGIDPCHRESIGRCGETLLQARVSTLA